MDGVLTHFLGMHLPRTSSSHPVAGRTVPPDRTARPAKIRLKGADLPISTAPGRSRLVLRLRSGCYGARSFTLAIRQNSSGLSANSVARSGATSYGHTGCPLLAGHLEASPPSSTTLLLSSGIWLSRTFHCTVAMGGPSTVLSSAQGTRTLLLAPLFRPS